MIYRVETTRDDEAAISFKDLQADRGRWKLVKEFIGDMGRREAHRVALNIRDGNGDRHAPRPVVRVRSDDGTELIMQRLRYRNAA